MTVELGQVRVPPKMGKYEDVQNVVVESGPLSGDEVMLARIQEMEAKIQASQKPEPAAEQMTRVFIAELAEFVGGGTARLLDLVPCLLA